MPTTSAVMLHAIEEMIVARLADASRILDDPERVNVGERVRAVDLRNLRINYSKTGTVMAKWVHDGACQVEVRWDGADPGRLFDTTVNVRDVVSTGRSARGEVEHDAPGSWVFHPERRG